MSKSPLVGPAQVLAGPATPPPVHFFRQPAGRLAGAALLAAALLATGARTQAAVAFWDGDAAIGTPGDNVTWGTAANWTTNGVNDVLPANTDDLTFGNGTAGATIDLGSNRVANSINFSKNYTLGLTATALTLTNTAGTMTAAANVTGTINAVLAGATGLNLTGGGTVLLNRATGNTFTGNITVDGSTLAYVGTNSSADPTALGAGAKTVTLKNNGAISVVTASSNPTAGSKTFVIDATGGTINVASGLLFTLDDGGQFSGAGTLNKMGDGVLLLSNQAFAYTGPTINVSGGTLRVSANSGVLGTGAVNINITNGGSYDNLVGLAGTKSITVSGTGVASGGAIVASTGTTSNVGGTVTLAGDTSIGATGPTTVLNISGTIGDNSGGYALSKVGTGVAALTGTNTYTGITNVSAGVLRAASGVGLPNTTNLNLAGGAFETTAASFTRNLGLNPGEVQVNGGDSGFSSQATGGAIINLGGSGATVAFGSATFNPTNFVLQAATASTPLTFLNPLDLVGVTRTIAVNATTLPGANTATLSGVVSDSTNGAAVGLTKAGPGVLILGANNTYAGPTTVTGGALRGALGTNIPSTSNLILNGGAYESGSNITTTLGTGAGQVQIGANGGGFSAYGAAITVNLGGASAPVQFGAGAFAGSTLILNQASSNSTIDFQNPLDLNGGARTIAANGSVATVSNVISDSSATPGSLTKSGSGVLVLSNTNTYTGTTTVTGGGLRANDGVGLPTTGNLTLNGGNLETSANFTRALGATPGQVQLLAGTNSGFSAIGTPVAVNLGGAGATLVWGTTTFNPAALIINGSAATSALDFQNAINLNGATRSVQSNSTSIGTISGVISNSTGTAGLNFAGSGSLALTGTNTYNGGTTISSSGTLIFDRDANLGASAGAVSFTASSTTAPVPTLRYTGTGETSARVINLAATVVGATLEMAGTGTLRITGNVNSTGVGAKQLTLIGSTAGIGELAGVINTNGGTSVYKNGTGTWRLSGANTFTGAVNINQGALIVSNSAALGSGTKTITLSAGTAGNPQLQLEGNITLPSTFTYSTSNVSTTTTGSFINLSGNNTVQGIINPTSGGGDTAFVSQAGNLTISATIAQTANNGLRNLRLRGAGNGSLTGAISNGFTGATVGIVQEGTGTWSVTGANTFTAASSATSGTLLANNTTGSALGTASMTVSGTGTFGGSGSISGTLAVNAGGTVNPGNAVGTLSIGSAVTLTGTALTTAGRAGLSIELQPSNATTPNDVLALTGAGTAGVLSLATNFDQLNLLPVELVGSTPITLTIATFASVNGIFNSVLVNGAATQNTDQLAANYVNVIYNANNIQVQVANLAAVPEPATLGLLLGVAPLFLARRRRA